MLLSNRRVLYRLSYGQHTFTGWKDQSHKLVLWPGICLAECHSSAVPPCSSQLRQTRILHFSSFFCSYQATWWHRGRGKKGATARTCVGRSKRCMKIKACRQSKNTVHDCAHIISLEPERLPFNNAPCVRKARNPQQKPCDFFFFFFFRGSSKHAREMILKGRMIRYRCNYN